jgi:cobalt-zinc-cadmium efflux system outer membrane protein
MQKSEREISAAIKRLASWWGSSSPSFTAVRGELDIPEYIPVADEPDSLVALNPEILRWSAEIDRHRAALALERALRIPDLTLSGGVRRFEDTDDTMYLFGLSIPLPIFDRNQGGVREARFSLEKAAEEQRAAAVRIRTELSEALGALSSAHAEALTLKRVALPAAEQAFTAAREGYRQGKFGFLEVLDAQKTYAEVRYQYIESLVAYHRSIARLERLIGGPFDASTDRTAESPLGQSLEPSTDRTAFDEGDRR